MRVNVTLDHDSAAVRAYLTSPSGAVFADGMKRATRVANKARTLCPVDQGTLRASIGIKVKPGPVFSIGSDLEYATYVHEGTGIHGPRGTMIVPRQARVLRWPAKNNSGVGTRRYRGGKTAAYVFSRRSRGSPPRPFLRNALDAARG